MPPVVAAVGSSRKELITFQDGGPHKGDPCGYHGYPRIESKLVIRIADWIKSAR